MINKVWLDNLGLDVPKTTADLKKVLIAFRDGDPNGNGKKDELPFGFIINDGFAQHLKCMYGWWGMPTKNGIGISDGDAYWVPTTQAYKDYILYMADLYKNGLIDPEAMTWGSDNRAQFDAKVDAPDGPKYGFIIAQRGYTGTPGKDQFISIAPPAPAGYKPEVWVHPGRLAIKNVWFMTDSNDYPEHTMAWVDRLYTLEQSVQTAYGIAPEGVKLVGKTWTPQDISPDRRRRIGVGGAFPGIFDRDDYDEGRLVLDKNTQFLYDNYYDVYLPYKAKEQWVRAEFSADEQKEVDTLRTDIQTLWLSKQAQWISGVADVNAEWDAYVKQMKAMNVDRYVELHDIAHKRFSDAIGDFR
jgi:putative aldouronate transport system substrate-binding protein